MQPMLQLYQQVALLVHFLPMILWLLIVISMSWKNNSFRFSKEWVPISEQYFHRKMRIGQTANAVLEAFIEYFEDRMLSNSFLERFRQVWF
jgi:cell shape-determining protein MreC